MQGVQVKPMEWSVYDGGELIGDVNRAPYGRFEGRPLNPKDDGWNYQRTYSTASACAAALARWHRRQPRP